MKIQTNEIVIIVLIILLLIAIPININFKKKIHAFCEYHGMELSKTSISMACFENGIDEIGNYEFINTLSSKGEICFDDSQSWQEPNLYNCVKNEVLK
ncbi:MAG: hypothetical protein AABY22_01535 [Nanoarchaeota archaeon]